MQNGSYDSNPSPLTVAVVGLGKIGLPLAVQFAQYGWRVIGCDINPRVVGMINTGQSHIQEEQFAPSVQNGRYGKHGAGS